MNGSEHTNPFERTGELVRVLSACQLWCSEQSTARNRRQKQLSLELHLSQRRSNRSEYSAGCKRAQAALLVRMTKPQALQDKQGDSD